MKCEVGYCQSEAKSRFATLCERHYARKRRGHADWDQPSQYEKSPEQRFWEKVDDHGGFPDFSDPLVRVTEADGECRLWGAGQRGPYGCFVLDGENRPAHVVALILEGFTVDTSLTVDHLCRRELCVNTRHLEQVTSGMNSLRSSNLFAANARKTRCSRGHEFTPGSFYVDKRGGWRKCKECNLILCRARRARLKAAQ